MSAFSAISATLVCLGFTAGLVTLVVSTDNFNSKLAASAVFKDVAEAVCNAPNHNPGTIISMDTNHGEYAATMYEKGYYQTFNLYPHVGTVGLHVQPDGHSVRMEIPKQNIHLFTGDGYYQGKLINVDCDGPANPSVAIRGGGYDVSIYSQYNGPQ